MSQQKINNKEERVASGRAAAVYMHARAYSACPGITCTQIPVTYRTCRAMSKTRFLLENLTPDVLVLNNPAPIRPRALYVYY